MKITNALIEKKNIKRRSQFKYLVETIQEFGATKLQMKFAVEKWQLQLD